MMNITLPEHSYILAIQIGGAHITAALVCQQTHELLPSGYVRLPISHRAGEKVILSVWMDAVRGVIKEHRINLKGCMIAVPAAFDPEKRQQMNEGYGLYRSMDNIDISGYFASVLNLPLNEVTLCSPAVALLNGLTFRIGSKASSHLVIMLGTDLCAAVCRDHVLSDLQWEFEHFNENGANHLLSTQWLSERYYKLSGFCILNIEQLASLYPTSPTVRRVFREYAANLATFIRQQISGMNFDLLLLEGDPVLAGDFFQADMKHRLADFKVEFVPAGKMDLLRGAALLTETSEDLSIVQHLASDLS